MSASLGGITVGPVTANSDMLRFAGLLWGPAGAGKTTLAATAPGYKLILCFDPDGELSLMGRDDCMVMAFYDQTPTTVVSSFRGADPYGLTKYLRDNPHIQTVVFDSVTTYAHMALQMAVLQLGKNVTMELPSIAGYAWRNSAILSACQTMLRITAALRRNIIFTTHEGAPDRDTAGNITAITMILSDNLANQLGLRINEVWHIRDDGQSQRTISVRPHSRMKPMKTRMFDARRGTQFQWHYDAIAGKGEGIADWWQEWRSTGERLPLPSKKEVKK